MLSDSRSPIVISGSRRWIDCPAACGQPPGTRPGDLPADRWLQFVVYTVMVHAGQHLLSAAELTASPPGCDSNPQPAQDIELGRRHRHSGLTANGRSGRLNASPTRQNAPFGTPSLSVPKESLTVHKADLVGPGRALMLRRVSTQHASCMSQQLTLGASHRPFRCGIRSRLRPLGEAPSNAGRQNRPTSPRSWRDVSVNTLPRRMLRPCARSLVHKAQQEGLSQNRKRPLTCTFLVAGAGFEPATSGL